MWFVAVDVQTACVEVFKEQVGSEWAFSPYAKFRYVK